MQRAEAHPLDDTTTPVLVCGVLAGLAGATAGMLTSGVISLVRGEGLVTPAKLVAGSLMGREALESDNAMAATLIGLLLTVIAASAGGALFAWMRRREPRFRLLIAEGIGFGLVLFGAVWIALPHINPVMHAHTPWAALAIAYAVYGAALALELPLRVGSISLPVEEVRRSLSDA